MNEEGGNSGIFSGTIKHELGQESGRKLLVWGTILGVGLVVFSWLLNKF